MSTLLRSLAPPEGTAIASCRKAGKLPRSRDPSWCVPLSQPAHLPQQGWGLLVFMLCLGLASSLSLSHVRPPHKKLTPSAAGPREFSLPRLWGCAGGLEQIQAAPALEQPHTVPPQHHRALCQVLQAGGGLWCPYKCTKKAKVTPIPFFFFFFFLRDPGAKHLQTRPGEQVQQRPGKTWESPREEKQPHSADVPMGTSGL